MIKVLRAGIQTTVQDRGRVGYAHLGIPVSGVMDAYAAGLANAVLGNSEGDAVLEITLGKVSLLFENEYLIAISGADLSPEINRKQVALNTAIRVVQGDELTLNKPVFGVRSYLAVKGGFQTPKVLGSKSYYKNITEPFLLANGDILPADPFSGLKTLKNAIVKANTAYYQSKIIEVTKGPEYELLNEDQQQLLKNTVFTISKDNNRMGYRLVETIENSLPSMLTSSVLPGTVQLTPSGTLIVLMRDCQVTGGYPRILQLREMAVNSLAQKTTNDKFQFKILS